MVTVSSLAVWWFEGFGLRRAGFRVHVLEACEIPSRVRAVSGVLGSRLARAKRARRSGVVGLAVGLLRVY